MVKYSKTLDKSEKAAQAKGSYLRIHYKHCREIGRAIKGLGIEKAKSYLKDVLSYKDGIPYTKYTGGIGRHSVAKKHAVPGDKVSFPQKATKSFLDILTNVQANAEAKGLELEKVKITHVNVNQAPKMRRRTYRAHGRINAYMSSPAHINLIVEEVSDEVVKEEEKSLTLKLSKKQIAIKSSRKSGQVPVGGGDEA